MNVQDYIDKHELTKRVEDAINATVKAKPDEPLSFLVSTNITHSVRFKFRGGRLPTTLHACIEE